MVLKEKRESGDVMEKAICVKIKDLRKTTPDPLRKVTKRLAKKV